MNGSPSMALACVLKRLPPCYRTPHAILSIELAYAYGYADRLWTRCDAVWLAMLAAFESVEGRGNGNRAKRRAANLCRQRRPIL